jgi:hypothetical protein
MPETEASKPRDIQAPLRISVKPRSARHPVRTGTRETTPARTFENHGRGASDRSLHTKTCALDRSQLNQFTFLRCLRNESPPDARPDLVGNPRERGNPTRFNDGRLQSLPRFGAIRSSSAPSRPYRIIPTVAKPPSSVHNIELTVSLRRRSSREGSTPATDFEREFERKRHHSNCQNPAPQLPRVGAFRNAASEAAHIRSRRVSLFSRELGSAAAGTPSLWESSRLKQRLRGAAMGTSSGRVTWLECPGRERTSSLQG